jgi:hypothetical protein
MEMPNAASISLLRAEGVHDARTLLSPLRQLSPLRSRWTLTFCVYREHGCYTEHWERFRERFENIGPMPKLLTDS